VKLLLDEMHAPRIADVLRGEGWDVVAVAAELEMRGVADEELLARASADLRVLVTENIGDFAEIAARWAQEQRPHGGLVFTNPRRFNRAMVAYPGNVTVGLRVLLENPPPLGVSGIWWL
jgi:hypothetical protein